MWWYGTIRSPTSVWSVIFVIALFAAAVGAKRAGILRYWQRANFAQQHAGSDSHRRSAGARDTARALAPMDKGSKFWLVVEVAVTFLPLVLAWIILLMIVPIQVMALRELPHEEWVDPILVFYLLVAGPIGMTGMYAMLVYLLRDGRRVLSNRAMLVCVGVGIVTLALPVIPAWEFTLLGMLCLLPLLCALHVLYLGRSYFSDNKPFQPIARDDARSG